MTENKEMKRNEEMMDEELDLIVGGKIIIEYFEDTVERKRKSDDGTEYNKIYQGYTYKTYDSEKGLLCGSKFMSKEMLTTMMNEHPEYEFRETTDVD